MGSVQVNHQFDEVWSIMCLSNYIYTYISSKVKQITMFGAAPFRRLKAQILYRQLMPPPAGDGIRHLKLVGLQAGAFGETY